MFLERVVAGYWLRVATAKPRGPVFLLLRILGLTGVVIVMHYQKGVTLYDCMILYLLMSYQNLDEHAVLFFFLP